jgi:glycosyltransferase involved in cell wall biosynthesis
MKWIIAAPYPTNLSSGLWKTIQEYGSQHQLLTCQPDYKHNRSRDMASKQDWADYWKHSNDIWTQAQENDAGIITAFPQLAVCIGIRKRFSTRQTPIIAGTFNLGQLHNGYKKQLARIALKKVDKFIVHSTAELPSYSQYLKIPRERFEFIHLHKPIMPITEAEELNTPFLLSMGTANRDYKTLFKAVEELNYPLTVVTPRQNLTDIEIPDCVTIKSNLSIQECRDLVQKARLNIISIDNEQTGSGQVTIIEAMMYRKAVISTNTIGSRDYIEHGLTGLLYDSKSVKQLEQAIKKLWTNAELRNQLANKAYNFIKDELSHEKTALKMLAVLDRFQ